MTDGYHPRSLPLLSDAVGWLADAVRHHEEPKDLSGRRVIPLSASATISIFRH